MANARQRWTAVTQQIKPDVYPLVEDEATIILTYPRAQVIIQASWNWNFNRKDIEIYCQHGHLRCLDGRRMMVRQPGDDREQLIEASANGTSLMDPYDYFAAVVRQEITMDDADLSSLENNIVVCEILEAAKLAANTGRTQHLKSKDTP